MTDNLLSLAKALGAKNIYDSPFAKNRAALNYNDQNQRYEDAKQLLTNAQTPVGAIGGAIAYFLQSKKKDKARDELSEELQLQNQKAEQDKLILASVLPDAQQDIGSHLDMDTLTKLAYGKLSKDPLDEEYKRAQITKINNDIKKSSPSFKSGGGGFYNPKVAQAIDTEILKKSAEQANSASGSLAKLNQLEDILIKNDTGRLSALGEKIGQYVPGFDSKDYQSAEALTSELGLEATNLLKGPASDKDVARSILTNPSYQNTKEANKEIIKNKKVALQIARDQAGFNANWISKYGSTLNTNEKGQDYNPALVNWQRKKFEELGGVKQKEEAGQVDNSNKISNSRKEELKKKYKL